MNFRRIGPNTAESDTGVRVERSGRTELRYSEASKTTIVEVEPGNRLAIYESTICAWLPPHEEEPLTDQDRARILSRVAEALKFLGTDFVIS